MATECRELSGVIRVDGLGINRQLKIGLSKDDLSRVPDHTDTGTMSGVGAIPYFENGMKMGLRWWRDVLIRDQAKRYLDGR